MIFNRSPRPGRLRAIVGIIALILGTLVGVTPVPTLADGLGTSAEYMVAFFRYVQWQNEDKLAAWNICQVSELPPEQAQTYATHTVRDKPFVVHRISPDASLADCQALDLTTARIETATHLLSRARHLPILTVGSSQQFCSIGGQICLYVDNSAPKPTQKFAVNLSNVKESRLQVSARLLAIGTTRASEDTP